MDYAGLKLYPRMKAPNFPNQNSYLFCSCISNLISGLLSIFCFKMEMLTELKKDCLKKAVPSVSDTAEEYTILEF